MTRVRGLFLLLMLSAAPAARASAQSRLVARAILPADTFAQGPMAGRRLARELNGRKTPFGRQPVQGFSALLDEGDGTFLALVDNGFGTFANSADARLRIYRLRPHFETSHGGPGSIEVVALIELRDPDRKAPFTITEAFTAERYLTGADFDPESMQRARDGTLWLGDEFGPFLLHFSADGRLLDAPYELPDFARGGVVRAPENPRYEESAPLRVMNAFAHHARLHGANDALVSSPTALLLADGDATTAIAHRLAPDPASGLAAASSELFDVRLLRAGGFPVVPYTVNDAPRMRTLLAHGVAGIITDRPDLLVQEVAQYDADGDGRPGDFIGANGLIDRQRFDVEGHRGARNLRPENTLPAMEAALDALATTLETDVGISLDGVPLINHDLAFSASKCRRADGSPYTRDRQLRVAGITAAALQNSLICDKLLSDRADQRNDHALSPVSVAYADAHGLIDPYAVPTLDDLFAFVAFYADYFAHGPGVSHPDARRRTENARRVHFNVELKSMPERAREPATSPRPAGFAAIVAERIRAHRLAARTIVQSFDFRPLLALHERYPELRTAYLFADQPRFADPNQQGSGDGNNLQPLAAGRSTWLAGLPWPYRATQAAQPSRAQSSGGFEGLAIDPKTNKLYALLERALTGDEPRTLLISEFDIAQRRFTSTQYRYSLDPRAAGIGDFALFAPRSGLVVERDDGQGSSARFKAIYEITLPSTGSGEVQKRLVADLLAIENPHGLARSAAPADVGLGPRFALPFVTIESVLVLSPWHIAVLNDNNYPKSVGRHEQSQQPDDSELVILRLDQPLHELHTRTTLQHALDYYWLR